MKKLIFLILLSFSVSSYSQNAFTTTLKANFDLEGINKVTDVFFSDSLSGEQDIDPGYAIAAEICYDVIPFLSLGAGLSYQFRRDGDVIIKSDSTIALEEELTGIEYEKGKFGYIPVYAIVKLTPYESKIITPRLVGQVGYNLFHGDDNFKGDYLLNGGLVYGAGISLDIYRHYQFEVLYKAHKGGVSHADEKFFDAGYSYISLSLGVNF